MIAGKTRERGAAVIAVARTPFAKAGGPLAKTHVTELARVAFRETLYRAGWPASRVDEVVLGNVVMPADAANPARVAAIGAGLPHTVPALTVQRNCASGMEAVAQGAQRIERGEAGAVLAGGAESMSTVPLIFPLQTLGPMARLARARTLMQKVAAAATLRPRHFRPLPALKMGLTDPTCGMMMGDTAEVLAHEFGISRAQQDELALESHRRAIAAAEAGRFDEQIVPVYAGERFEPVTRDIGPRAEQSMEALAKLRPVFDRRHGSITVGNACQITDGAAAMLLADAELARAEGLAALGYVRAYAVAALDPARMGLGPVFAIDRLLRKTGHEMGDIDLFEINEAFAAQVLACRKAMGSDRFAQEHLGRDSALGEPDPERLNVSGGAIALGHPVGASGARLVMNLLLEMHRRDAELGVAALCIGGGQGAAVLLQRS